MSLWVQIGYLAGHSHKTLDRHKPFEVTSVSSTDVRIYIYSSLRKRTIKRAEIEGAYKELEEKGKLTTSDIRKRHSKASPTYIAAILAALPGVWYRTGPIRLYLET
jgi:hypothetical protein